MSSAQVPTMVAVTLYVLLLGFVPCLANINVLDETAVPSDCLRCICIVESGCTMPSPVCSMDVGSLSCGPYQIKEGYWIDAKEKGGQLDGDWKKCTSTFECSARAVQGYMARYAIISRLGHAPTCEDFARIHNGGPQGYLNPATLQYWDKVKMCLGNRQFMKMENMASDKNFSKLL